jgi:hypothetical protein
LDGLFGDNDFAYGGLGQGEHAHTSGDGRSGIEIQTMVEISVDRFFGGVDR